MSAFDAILTEKANTVVDARNKAREGWLNLENEYNKLDPSKKPAKNDLLNKLGNKFSELRDIAKQKRTQSVEKQDDAYSESQKLIAKNFLKKGGG